MKDFLQFEHESIIYGFRLHAAECFPFVTVFKNSFFVDFPTFQFLITLLFSWIAALVYITEHFCLRFVRCTLLSLHKNAFLMAESHFEIYEDSLNSIKRFMALWCPRSLLELWKKCVSAIIVDALRDFKCPLKRERSDSHEKTSSTLMGRKEVWLFTAEVNSKNLKS